MAVRREMNVDERRVYLGKVQERYWAGSRSVRSRLLDEMVAVTGLHRKSVIRLIRGELERKPRRRQRGRVYGVEVEEALGVIAESLDYICAERLQPSLVWMAEHLAGHGEMTTTPELLEKLGRISVSTVGRMLQRLRQDELRLPRKGPEEAHRIRRSIPMERMPWDIQAPGYFEVDLVHHCGREAVGEYVCTVQMVDIATGWSERVAVLGRSYRAMADGFQRIAQRLPFAVVKLHPDNGSEFLNHHMLRFWQEKFDHPQLSRSRPYRKNDNRFVEQKNSTLVRAYLGYERLDSVAHTLALNQLYEQMWLYYNFFQPVMRLKDKEHIADNGHSRTKRRFHPAQTPLQALLKRDVVPAERQTQMETIRRQVNPRQLRQQIYEGIDELFTLPGAAPGKTEDVFKTLLKEGAVGAQYGLDRLNRIGQLVSNQATEQGLNNHQMTRKEKTAR